MMVEAFNYIVDNAINLIQLYGYGFGFLIIFLESIFPWLPLCVFIALNIASFGIIEGFLLSWCATVCGCLCSYWFFKKVIGHRIEKIFKGKKLRQIKKIILAIEKLDFTKLVLIIALPFSPAFLINIACGVANMKFKKFFIALLMGKVAIVFFWGFIGKSLIDSITDVNTIIVVCLLMIFVYFVSKLVVKKFDL